MREFGMPTFDSSTLIKRTPHQVSCKLDDEVAILNLDTALYFGVDRVGAQIWAALEAPTSFAALCDDVVGHFEVSPEACRCDVEKFLTRLHENGLIELVT
jgi:hypothetical protein